MTLRAFIVEDDVGYRSALEAMLAQDATVEVVGHAETESAALTWLLDHPGDWDVAVVDLLLREGNGLRVLAACRVRLPGQHMIVLTNSVTPEMRRRCSDLGADAVFYKLTEFERLLDQFKRYAADGTKSRLSLFSGLHMPRFLNASRPASVTHSTLAAPE